MYKHCTTEEGVLRQRQLEQCLLELMQTLPYSQITVGTLCDRAGVSRKSFYRYFSGKEGCLCALLDHCIIEGAAYYLPESGRELTVHIIHRRFFDYWQQKSALLEALHTNGMSAQLAERMMAYVMEEERDLHRYLGGEDKDSYEQMLFWVSGVLSLVFSRHRSGYQKSSDQMAAVMEKLTRSESDTFINL